MKFRIKIFLLFISITTLGQLDLSGTNFKWEGKVRASPWMVAHGYTLYEFTNKSTCVVHHGFGLTFGEYLDTLNYNINESFINFDTLKKGDSKIIYPPMKIVLKKKKEIVKVKKIVTIQNRTCYKLIEIVKE